MDLIVKSWSRAYDRTSVLWRRVHKDCVDTGRTELSVWCLLLHDLGQVFMNTREALPSTVNLQRKWINGHNGHFCLSCVVFIRISQSTAKDVHSFGTGSDGWRERETHTNTHTHIETNKHTYTHTCARTRTHARTHARTHTHTHTHYTLLIFSNVACFYFYLVAVTLCFSKKVR